MNASRPSSLSTFLGGIAVFAAMTGLIALLVPALYAKRVDELREERGWGGTPSDVTQTKAAQSSRLSSYAWIDRANGVVALPIERAMEIYAAEANRAAREGGGK